MLRKIKLNNLLHKMLIVGIALGYFYISYYYYKRYLSLNQFVTVTATVLLIVPALLFIRRPYNYELIIPKMKQKNIIFTLPYAVFLSSLIDIWSAGHLGIFSIVSLVITFNILLFSKSDLSTVLAGVASIAVIISILYGIYTPSFGNDTWRDATQASQIIERGGLHGLTIIHQAYPFPVISFLYAMQSLVAGLNTLWSSSILGLLYLFLLALFVYYLSKNFSTTYHHIAVLLILTISLAVIWSVWFIPQAYSLLMALPLLFLDLNFIIVSILSVALVLGHGGLASWTLAMLLLFALSKRLLKIRFKALDRVEVKLAITLLIFISYAIYTTVFLALRGSYSSVINTLLAFLYGEKIGAASTSIQNHVTSVLGIVPVIVIVTLGVIVMIEGKDPVVRLLAFLSLAWLGLSYAGAVAFPALDLPRYLGLPSVVTLTLIAPLAIEILTTRGKAGTYYSVLLIILAIFSFSFAGEIMPENPYTANPYTTWSISGLITHSEAQELDNIAFKLCCNNYLLDWRSGAYIGYKYLWIQPLSKGFYNPETQGFFTHAGSYGFLVTPKYLTNFNGVLIFRQSSLNMLEAYSPGIDVFLNNMIDKVSIPYMSSQIRIILYK